MSNKCLNPRCGHQDYWHAKEGCHFNSYGLMCDCKYYQKILMNQETKYIESARYFIVRVDQKEVAFVAQYSENRKWCKPTFTIRQREWHVSQAEEVVQHIRLAAMTAKAWNEEWGAPHYTK